MEKWLEGHEIAQTLIPRFNKLPLGFFDGSRRRSVRGGELALSARVGQNEAKRMTTLIFLRAQMRVLQCCVNNVWLSFEGRKLA